MANDRRRASDFPPEVLSLFDGYVHGDLDRRGFLERAAKYAIGGLTAIAMLDLLSPNFAWAEQVSKADKRLATEKVTFASPSGTKPMGGYLTRPIKPAGKLPGVLVIHENRGLSPYIEDVARRFALEGYVAFAPDALTSVGGYPGDEDKAKAAFSALDETKRNEDMLAAAAYLKARKDATAKIGCIGFCWGGTTTNLLAAKLPWLAAAVPFYGVGPSADDAKAIKAAMQMHFAETDERVNTAWPAYKKALEDANIKFEAFSYPGTQHGFHNDTTPRYDETAAKLAWSRTLAHFKKYLH